jgi:uncharacterized membrane protein YciS (DUF1049 family)
MSYPDRVAAKVADVKLSRLLLTVLAAPFYALGFILGVLFAAVLWCGAAIAVGVSDARKDRVTDGAA